MKLLILFFSICLTVSYAQDNEHLAIELLGLENRAEINAFLERNPEATLMLFDELNGLEDYSRIKDTIGDLPCDFLIPFDEVKLRVFKDTVITTFSFYYIYISSDSPKKLDKKLKKVNKTIAKKSFAHALKKYGNPEPIFHRMQDIESGLLEDELATSLQQTSPGEVCVARLDQRVFICQLSEEKKQVNAYLGVIIPR